MKPRLLDLFCGAGGAAMGYHRAGFEVVGVDIAPQPNYPFTYRRGDALAVLRWLANDHGSTYLDLYDGKVTHSVTRSEIHAIHASPPCQRYSTLAAMHPDREYVDLIPPTRELLMQVGLPWIIENVEPAPLARHSNLFGAHGVMLCGSMFGLGVERGYLRRHRVFETTFAVAQPQCRHVGLACGVYGHGGHSGKHRMLYRKEAAEALDIDWMTRDEMAQSIPPAYTEFIGAAVLEHISAVAA